MSDWGNKGLVFVRKFFSFLLGYLRASLRDTYAVFDQLHFAFNIRILSLGLKFAFASFKNRFT